MIDNWPGSTSSNPASNGGGTGGGTAAVVPDWFRGGPGTPGGEGDEGGQVPVPGGQLHCLDMTGAGDVEVERPGQQLDGRWSAVDEVEQSFRVRHGGHRNSSRPSWIAGKRSCPNRPTRLPAHLQHAVASTLKSVTIAVGVAFVDRGRGPSTTQPCHAHMRPPVENASAMLRP